MAGKKSDIPFEKVSLNLGQGDFEEMGRLFPRIGAGVAIRTLVRNYIRQIKAATAAPEIDIDHSNIEALLDDDREPVDGSAGNPQPEADPRTL
jgi:hypothetical protein